MHASLEALLEFFAEHEIEPQRHAYGTPAETAGRWPSGTGAKPACPVPADAGHLSVIASVTSGCA